MDNRALVSVITPTYNRANFIKKAIESVQLQTYKEFELIIIDDGSTDSTDEVVRPFLSDERITYIYQKNKGQSAARNLGISRSGGKYIAFLDSDNVWFPERLEVTVDALEKNTGFDVVYGDCVIIDKYGQEVSRNNMRRHSGHITKYLLQDNCVSINTATVRRRCLERSGCFDVQNLWTEDYELWLRISLTSEFLYIPKYLAYYRVMSEQISNDKGQRFKSNEEVIVDFLTSHPNAVGSGDVAAAWCSFYTRKARWLGGEGRIREALACCVMAIRSQPLSVRPWRAMGALPRQQVMRTLRSHLLLDH